MPSASLCRETNKPPNIRCHAATAVARLLPVTRTRSVRSGIFYLIGLSCPSSLCSFVRTSSNYKCIFFESELQWKHPDLPARPRPLRTWHLAVQGVPNPPSSFTTHALVQNGQRRTTLGDPVQVFGDGQSAQHQHTHHRQGPNRLSSLHPHGRKL